MYPLSSLGLTIKIEDEEISIFSADEEREREGRRGDSYNRTTQRGLTD
jgi:hypothetical protein